MMPSASGSGIAANAPAAFEAAPRRGAPPAASSAALAPAPVPAPAAAPAGRSDPFTRTVRVGDSLWTLVEDVYGFVNPTVVRRVQDANPNIRNINVLTPGQEVVFPRVPEMAFDRGTSLFESTPPTGQSR